jgi:acylglycerol lipase
MAVPAIKYYPMRLLSNVMPSFTINAGLNADGMSHDQDAIKEYLEDPLIHDYATIGTSKFCAYILYQSTNQLINYEVRGFLDAGQAILDSQAQKIKTPILYSHGDADPINAYDSTAKAFQLTASADKELKTWSGLYHECKLFSS